jgi:hypothetical protein
MIARCLPKIPPKPTQQETVLADLEDLTSTLSNAFADLGACLRAIHKLSGDTCTVEGLALKGSYHADELDADIDPTLNG